MDMNKWVQDVAAQIKPAYDVVQTLPEQLEVPLNTIREGLEGIQREIASIQPITISITTAPKIDPDLIKYYIKR